MSSCNSLLFLTSCLTHNSFFFFFNDTATTEIYTLSLHDALPILAGHEVGETPGIGDALEHLSNDLFRQPGLRSEEHTSELQSQSNLVCRLLLEKKKKILARSITPERTNNLTTRLDTEVKRSYTRY